MGTFTVSTDIAAPAERVWEVVWDMERWHEWTPSITSVRRLGSGPFGVGSRVLIRQPKLPPAMWTVTDVEPGRRFAWISVAPGVQVTACHAVESVGHSSRATLSVEVQGIFGGFVWRMTRAITERYVTSEANGLKARSEHAEGHHSQE